MTATLPSFVVCTKRALCCALLCVPAIGGAEVALRTGSSSGATAHVDIRVVIPPVFKVLEVTAAADAWDYRVWTNMRAVHVNGREYRIPRLGETTLRIPSTHASEMLIVHGL